MLVELESNSTSKYARYRSRTDWRNLTSQWIRVSSGNGKDIGVYLSCLEKYDDISMKYPEFYEILEGSL
jgi:hypothetical protein